MKNIDIFNIAALEIFHLCTETFPLSTDFTAYEVADDVASYFKLSDDMAELQSEVGLITDVVFDTTYWLLREGFLYDRGSTDSHLSVTFTQKGLNAINVVPSSIEGKNSFKEVFINGLTSLTFATASSVMAEFFKNGS